ncbi:MAG: flagellar biosynthesis protein FlhB [Pararhizobium sp.]
MADEQDKDSKTEAPTEKKIRDAAEKGNVPFSREAPLFASTLAVLAYAIFFLPDGLHRFAVSLGEVFEKPDEWQLSTAADALSLFQHVMLAAAGLLLPAFVLMIAFGLAASILQNVPSPVLERVRPQVSRLSPVKGFTRLFGAPGMVEFAKSIAKIIVVSAIVALAMRPNYFAWLNSMYREPSTILVVMGADTRKVMTLIAGAMAVIAIADLFWSRYHWFTDLRMTKQEVKDEFKQTDGDPILKSRLRSLRRDRARKRMMNAVPRATMVIANPTHFAVALRYIREEGGAPVVLAKGQDLVALRIREIAEANGIPVFEDPPLARAMFAQVSVDSFIPPAFYKAVAELVHRVNAASARQRATGRRA